MTWLDLPDDHPYGVHALPYGAFRPALADRAGEAPQGRTESRSRAGVRIGDHVLDLTALLPDLFAAGTLDALLAAGPAVWASTRTTVTDWLTDERHHALVEPHLLPLDSVTMVLPFTVADYVDFYASEHHASNVGRMFRPGQPPLHPNWKHLPIGYHGRAGTVVVSGTPVVRPSGQRRVGDEVEVGPSLRLDLEAELGYVVGAPSEHGTPVPLDGFADHVFGVCLVNDWSARDLQAFESVPLGPFLAKSFATSVSGWVLPLAALEHARVSPPARDPRPAAYLDDTDAEAWGLDLAIEVRLNGGVVSRPPFASMYWTGAQMLAHLTSNGASLRTGDLYASGTVSGPERQQRGSLLELSWQGEEPLMLVDGTTRTFLEDGDEVVITATAPGPSGRRVGLGEVRGRVLPAPPR